MDDEDIECPYCFSFAVDYIKYDWFYDEEAFYCRSCGNEFAY